jgi:hypothetical protein
MTSKKAVKIYYERYRGDSSQRHTIAGAGQRPRLWDILEKMATAIGHKHFVLENLSTSKSSFYREMYPYWEYRQGKDGDWFWDGTRKDLPPEETLPPEQHALRETLPPEQHAFFIADLHP